MARKRPRPERQDECRKSSFRSTNVTTTCRFGTIGAMLLILSTDVGHKQTSQFFCVVEASSNGFPGTLQGSPTSASALSENWWLSSSFESSSSSEWDWEEPDDAIMSSSDAGETANNDNGTEVADELLNHDQNKTQSGSLPTSTNGLRQGSQTSVTPSESSSSSSNPQASIAGKNKPLQTLEKLQQMLDETDYMTTGRTASLSNGNSNKNGAERQDELWTSKDRSKYKKQQKKHHPAQKRILEMVEEQSTSSSQSKTIPKVVPPPPPQATTPTNSQQVQQQVSSQQEQQGWYPPPPPQYYQPHFNSATANGDLQGTSDPETTEQSDTDGDGLGYTLPNLPIYLSDNEDEGTDSDTSTGIPFNTASASNQSVEQNQATTTSSSSSSRRPSPKNPNGLPQQATPQNNPSSWQHPQQQQQQYQYPQQYQHPQQQQQWYGYPYVPPPPSSYGVPPQQQQQQQQQYYSWGPPPPQQPLYYPRPYVPRVDTTRRPLPAQQGQSQGTPVPPRDKQQQHAYYHQQGHEQGQNDSMDTSTQMSDKTQSQAMAFPMMDEATTTALGVSRMGSITEEKKNGSFIKILWNLMQIGSCVSLSMIMAYTAIPPGGPNVSMYEFNQKYYEVLRLVAWTSLPPLVTFWFGMVDVLDDKRSLPSSSGLANDEDDDDEDGRPIRRRNPHKTTMSKLISAFFNSFTWGYCLLFALQVAATTFARLAIFFRWERPVFDLTPKIPVLIIPWVLRENGYKPKRITLIVQDFVASCLLSPIIEEYLKVVLLQMTKLPKNFKWKKAATSSSSSNNNKNHHGKKKNNTPRQVAELIENPQGEVTNVNAYISNMLAVTLGIKLADSIRRVCMYTKSQNAAKTFYAIFRGVFPVRELCGTITALGLARRDVLGQHAPLWKILLPATVIHGMANFRGMKPVFKWNSATPWVEMQLSPPTVDLRSMKRLELFNLVFPKVLWLIILIRVTGYCVKNYFMVNRQAVKRTTTYAGKHSAFSAELAATEMLKASSKKGD